MNRPPYRQTAKKPTSQDIKKARECVHMGERIYDISIPC